MITIKPWCIDIFYFCYRSLPWQHSRLLRIFIFNNIKVSNRMAYANLYFLSLFLRLFVYILYLWNSVLTLTHNCKHKSHFIDTYLKTFNSVYLFRSFFVSLFLKIRMFSTWNERLLFDNCRLIHVHILNINYRWHFHSFQIFINEFVCLKHSSLYFHFKNNVEEKFFHISIII